MNAATDASPKLLVLGGPSSGKTTYRAQLYQRIEHQEGELKLVKSVGDRTAIEGDVERLVQGLQPMHTHLDVYQSTSFAVENRSNQAFLLEFADYGGEQVRRIADSNVVPTTWVDRARQADHWLFFLRIDSLRSLKSFMTDPVESVTPPEAAAPPSGTESSAELNAIETLQRLLFVRGASLRHPIASPRLAVFLSCWDELPESERKRPPEEVLAQRAPLFSKFVSANWLSDSFRIWGLSSTEKSLPETEPDLDFARKGSDKFGYIVLGDGKISRDLTIPVNWLMQTRS